VGGGGSSTSLAGFDEQQQGQQREGHHAQDLARMALFKVNTATREHEVRSLGWSWEVRVSELETSVFVVPGLT